MGPMALLTLASRFSPTQRAWLAVAGAWLVQIAAVGPVNAFGSYQAIYWNAYVPGVSASSLSWIGSLQIFFEFSVAIAGGILLDAGYFKETLLGGSILFTFSYFMLSLVKQGMFVPILLAQGFGMGIGLGLVFLPISGVVAQHFPTSRNLPLGIISTGAGFGGFAISLLTSKIYSNTDLGFGWTVRVAAFIVLGCLLAANLLITEVPASERVVTKSILKVDDDKETIEEEDGKSAQLAEVPLSQARTKEGVRSIISQHGDVTGLLASLRELLSSAVYLLTVAGGTLFVMGIFYPAYSIESFALAQGIDPGLASWLLPMSNLSSLIGRTVPAYVADRLGRYGAHIMFSTCAICAGALTIAMPACTSSGSIVAFAILYGLFQGAGPGLFFPTVLALGGPRPGFRLGVASVPLSIGALVGAPIASALLGPTAATAGAGGPGVADVNPNWWGGSAFAGAVWMASALSMGSALFLAKHKERRMRRGRGAGASQRSEKEAEERGNVLQEAGRTETTGFDHRVEGQGA
ncbi:MFS general substrate transporter [Microstroma glucosiphilum]|uniref:MFS general substrate transporter n=1 Tax=Pseudomicrostroma glucosiphilum TaxID=1684307 RepID=A0A316U6Q4_9BASI|nr:MFS general substrate transporter [Pseudomicrostroma glucosiphilum]PWN20909.1 MFS general substrate transporter [Pseudomicrostroma glucosiphilum]